MSTPWLLSDDETQTWQAWMMAARTFGVVLDRAVDEHAGLALVDFEILTDLRQAVGPRRMCDVGAAVALTRSGTTRAVARLEKMGLVARGPSATDRRSVVVEATQEGLDRQELAAQAFEQQVREHFFGVVSPEEAMTMSRCSSRIRQSLATPMECGVGRA